MADIMGSGEELSLSPDVLRAMPKVELHCHLDGSLRAETMLELARDQGVTLPRSDAESLRRYMRADGVGSLAEYLTRFDATIAILQTAEALERAAYELVEDVAAENVRYIEVRNAPRLNVRGGLSIDEVMEATLRGLARGEQDFEVTARFIVCSLRHWSPEISLEAAKLAVRYKDQGVVAFDLAGGEAGNPASAHAEAFAYARSHFLNVTCHAGEAAGPESIEDALNHCGAYRLGHGVRARENPALLDFLVDRQIPFELCPTSNVQTLAVESYANHPIREYLDRGAAVTINTDNRLISGTTLTDEFQHLVTHCDFTLDDLSECIENACRAAFLPLPDRVALFEMISDELAPLREAVEEPS
jgi:adenosine deaminase